MRVFKEKFYLNLVHLLPKTIVYWCAIRLMAHATSGKYGTTNPNELNIIDALKRWEGI